MLIASHIGGRIQKRSAAVATLSLNGGEWLSRGRFMVVSRRRCTKNTDGPITYRPVLNPWAGLDVAPTNPALREIIPTNLLDRFVFTGEQIDPARFMQAMDILCSSSWSEAFPNVIGEAMACALPCVVTDVGDCATIVDNTGIVVPPSDSQALAEGLLTMLEKPQAERDQFGHAARSRIKDHYALTQVVSRYTELYRTLLPDA